MSPHTALTIPIQEVNRWRHTNRFKDRRFAVHHRVSHAPNIIRRIYFRRMATLRVVKSESLRLNSQVSFSTIKCGRYFTSPV